MRTDPGNSARPGCHLQQDLDKITGAISGAIIGAIIGAMKTAGP